ncbi:urease accessory protein, partial [Streptomyces sp. WAC00276]|nr:urease accessory protein [Streptomyces sp. WAC00276]
MYRDESAGGAASGRGPAAPVTALGHLLTSLQLTDSAFPSGFYTLSHSLEGFAQAG